MSPPKDKDLPRGTAQSSTPSKHVSIRIRTRPLPTSVTEYLIENSLSIKRLYSERRGSEEEGEGRDVGVKAELDENDILLEANKAKVLSLADFKRGLKEAFEEAPSAEKEKNVWVDAVERIAAFGPRRIGPNILFDKTSNGLCRQL